MKAFIAFLSLALVACGEKTPAAHPLALGIEVQPQIVPASLNGYRVQDLLVVIFEKDLAAEGWKSVFENTQTLTQNRKRLQQIESDLDASEERLDLVGKNTTLLGNLADQSLFILNWSESSENCRLTFNTNLSLSCKPDDLQNPLNGSRPDGRLPQNSRPIEWIEPNPVTSITKIPYLSLWLQKSDRFEIELRLKIEFISNEKIWLKGEAIPSPLSRFRENSSRFYPYGYAEITFVK